MSDVPDLATEISSGKLFISLICQSASLNLSCSFLKLISQVEVRFCTCPDLPLLQGLLDVFPFASDDLEAQNAFWSVIAMLLVKVQEDKMSTSILHKYVSVIMSFSDVVEDDLLDHQLGDSSLEDKAMTPCGTNSESRITAVSNLSLTYQYQVKS